MKSNGENHMKKGIFSKNISSSAEELMLKWQRTYVHVPTNICSLKKRFYHVFLIGMVALVHFFAIYLAQIQRTPCVVDVGQDKRH